MLITKKNGLQINIMNDQLHCQQICCFVSRKNYNFLNFDTTTLYHQLPIKYITSSCCRTDSVNDLHLKKCCGEQGSEPVQGTKTKTETNKILTEPEPEPETKFYSSEQNQKIEMAINRLITLFYRSI